MNGTSYGQYEHARDDNGFRILNRLLIFIIIVALCIGSIIASIPVYKQSREQNAKLIQLQKDLAREKTLLLRRTREEQLLRNDPGYLEIVSRDRLDVMKPGETILHLEPPRPAGSPAAHPAKN